MTPGHGTTAAATLSLYLFTLNCALTPINRTSLSQQLFSGLEPSTTSLPDVLVLSLQELAPLAHSLIGGSFLVPYFARFHDAVEEAARKFGGHEQGGAEEIYTAVAARNIGMTGIMVFARDPAAIRDLETGSLGVGIWATGNKGAVGVRFTYENGAGSTELTFIAAHLAAMEWEVARRNEDWKSIVRGLVFSSEAKAKATSLSNSQSEARPLLSVSPRDASVYKPTSHLFVAGDLNYRTSSIKPGPEDHKDTFPQPHDPEEHANHWTKLFEDDQLNAERRAGRTMHGLVEAPVTFPPTYKYSSKQAPMKMDVEPSTWHWATHRWPSWCDRILYLPVPGWLASEHPEARIQVRKYSALPLMETSDHRAVAMDVTLPLLPIPAPPPAGSGTEAYTAAGAGADADAEMETTDPRIEPPFDLDPDWKSKREKARMLELLLGFTFYFTTTWEGAGVLAASIAGIVGSVFVLKAMLDF
ncbi:endonuclease/Exonuclease/phosphatase [Phlyctema vagabunda]|uniref:Endonuclease/Exonuclease/phosphatase n=1 Tax=Phlyctema vagabunda TaxID=108571 RepID=A0ABR4P6I3_9HELO